MAWEVLLHDAFAAEVAERDVAWQDELFAHARLLALVGPQLGRPTADTLKGSRHANMKELRFGWQREVWRVAFAFDPLRQAVLLAGAEKRGADQKRFYRRLVQEADARWDDHLTSLETDHGKTTR